MLTPSQAAAFEALADERIGALPEAAISAELRTELEAVDAEQAALALEALTAARPIEWATRSLSQGEILAAFVVHCLDELDDVAVLDATTTRLVARWRRETSRLELRAGFIGCEQVASETPTMLLGDIEAEVDALAEKFAADTELRSRLAVYDLARLEKIGAVRSSVFVYFEWFLRDAFGVKLQPSPAFTQRLIDRGVISLGMG